MSSYIIDIQGFRGIFNEYLPMELTILSQLNGTIRHLLIRRKEPMSYLPVKAKKMNDWLTNKYHGLKWDQGLNTVTDLEEEFNRIGCASIIYVKGEENVYFLRRYFWNVFDLEEMGCPELSNLQTGMPCWLHILLGQPNLNCSRKNVIAFRSWLSSQATEKSKASLAETDEVDSNNGDKTVNIESVSYPTECA